MSEFFNKLNGISYPYVIAEVSQNHDGSLGQAHAFIDAVATTGCDAIKFQTHIADQESTVFEPFRVKFSYEDKTRYDYWKRMEFTDEQWSGLYDHAKEKGLDFLSSPFSIKALELLDKIGVPAWKFGSGEVFNQSLLDRAIQTKKPIILSTGLSTYDEIVKQVGYIKSKNGEVCVLLCVTAYPSQPEMINILDIRKFLKMIDCPIGISDHSATVYPSLSAVTLGATVIEVHVTMSSYMFGPDVKASVTLEQLMEIVEGSRFITKMLRSKNNYDVRDSERESLKKMFSKSLYYNRDIAKGNTITEDDLIEKKPNDGIGSNMKKSLLGRVLNKGVSKDDLVRIEDFK